MNEQVQADAQVSDFILTPEQIAQCDTIVQRIAEGESLRKICTSAELPKMGRFLGWVARFPTLTEQYTRARNIQMDVWAEECLEIADDDSKDFGYKAVTNEDGQSAQVFINKDNIQRAKIKIDERHWQMSKQRPKKYGDYMKTENTHIFPHGLKIEFVQSPMIAPDDSHD